MLAPTVVIEPNHSSSGVTGTPVAPEAGRWRALAAVGPLLWQFGAVDPLQVMRDAVAAESRVWIGSDGPLESLSFRIESDSCAVFLLPDSDYLAWEGWLALLPPLRRPSTVTAPMQSACAALLRRRLWRRPGRRFAVMACEAPRPAGLPALRPVRQLSPASLTAVERIRAWAM